MEWVSKDRGVKETDMDITDYVVNYLEKLPIFDNRFINLRCINYDIATKTREGMFSLTFTAKDSVLDEDVIIKIFDPNSVGDTYRLECFDRESELLRQFISKRRCLQLKKDLSEVDVTVTGFPISIKLKYFATEYLPISIISEFYKMPDKSKITIEKKLYIFKQIVLALRAIHNFEVYHRDLKPDNMRGYLEKLKEIVVIIDFGTAICIDTAKLLSRYEYNVGASGYSSPEAIIGLSGNNRELAKYTDFYALGCLLFELFDFDFLFNKFEQVNSGHYLLVIQQLKSKINYKSDVKTQWHQLIKICPLIQYPEFNSLAGIPKSIIHRMNGLLGRLIQFDYRTRLCNFDEILRQIDICINIINNEAKYQRLIELKRKRRLEKKNAKMPYVQLERN
jgi:serine/threonine protein kinase